MTGSMLRQVRPYLNEAVVMVDRLNRPRRSNSRSTKRAVKYFWRVEHTDYGKRPCFLMKWNRKLRKFALKKR